MGRTIKTLNAHLQEEEESWAPARRAMRSREDRARIERVFSRMRVRTAECSCAARPIPWDALQMSWMIDVEEALERIERRLDEVEKRLGIEEVKDPATATMDLFEKG